VAKILWIRKSLANSKALSVNNFDAGADSVSVSLNHKYFSRPSGAMGEHQKGRQPKFAMQFDLLSDVYFGRQYEVLTERSKIKRRQARDLFCAQPAHRSQKRRRFARLLSDNI